MPSPKRSFLVVFHGRTGVEQAVVEAADGAEAEAVARTSHMPRGANVIFTTPMDSDESVRSCVEICLPMEPSVLTGLHAQARAAGLTLQDFLAQVVTKLVESRQGQGLCEG